MHSNHVKNGRTKSGKQRLRCKECGKTYMKEYSSNAYCHETNFRITGLLKEGVRIRSTSRLLGISKNTIIRRILLISKNIPKPIPQTGEIYEIDELRTYIGKKINLCWITYALDRNTRQVLDFNIGNRSNKVIGPVVDSVLRAYPKRIYTDRLINYRYLIPQSLHSTKLYGINHIERHNLTLRTHLKRLCRRTICFSKSALLLAACMKIYFWG